MKDIQTHKTTRFFPVLTGTTSFLLFPQISMPFYLKFFSHWATISLHSLGSSHNSLIFSFSSVGLLHGHLILSLSHYVLVLVVTLKSLSSVQTEFHIPICECRNCLLEIPSWLSTGLSCLGCPIKN